MTLRQDYAGPRPRAIAATGTSRLSLLTPTPPGSARRVSRFRRATAAATQPTNQGQAVPIAALGPGTLPQPRACHRLDPRGVVTRFRHLHLFPAALARCGELPLLPAPGTAGVYLRRPACGLRRWIRIQRAVAAGSGDRAGSCGFPVGVLSAVMCGEPSYRS
jgi:hypothetical protein